MTVKGGTSQACAACKHQRRKCWADCPLAPYFPPDKQKQFRSAHKLFGVSNILKILKKLDSTQKIEAMRSIVCQADIREKYPVHGCLGIVCNLQLQIHHYQQELDSINAQLAICRRHHQIQSPPTSSQLQLATAVPPTSNGVLPLFQQFDPTINGISIQNFPNPSNNNTNNHNVNSNYLNPLWIQHSQNHPFGANASNSAPMKSQYAALQPVTCQTQDSTGPQEYHEISPFCDILSIDDRQSYTDSKKAYESSSESSLKDTTQSMDHVSENELKSAAACFTLTSLN